MCSAEDEDQEHRADYNMNTAYWELATLMRYMEWACTFLTGEACAHWLTWSDESTAHCSVHK